ncbi:ribonuclease H-like domain-containing protein [Irpex rosettiformis]|uniref:Ribonuclease H-like domain-containing protein n=1 Tax=Irpex rosettiformis TaxID=378272 RepID=A0ACB8TV43_9APHY|nr:ribonuclease H-like domain-containing protein [Irpex rosettiformis]
MAALLPQSSSKRQGRRRKVAEPLYDLYSWKRISPTSRLVYIQDPQTLDLELSQLKPGPLGFDLEWKPTYVKGVPENPVALVQIASDDTILLIQVTSMRSFGFPASLQTLLENPDFSKAGVSILNDCKKLWRDYGINVRNCIELGLLARTVDNARWKGKYSEPIGLGRLCEIYHELSLAKGRVQRSNWEAFLSPPQQDYAANDCHSGLTIFKKLHPLINSMDLKPLPAFYSFDVFQGYPYQPSLAPLPMKLWQPHNPFYDPGPPPPPKPRKDAKTSKDEERTAETTSSIQDAASSSSSSSSSNVQQGNMTHGLPPHVTPNSTAVPESHRSPATDIFTTRGGFAPQPARIHGHVGNSMSNTRGRGPGSRGRERGRRGRGGIGFFSSNTPAVGPETAQQL